MFSTFHGASIDCRYKAYVTNKKISANVAYVAQAARNVLLLMLSARTCLSTSHEHRSIVTSDAHTISEQR
ncbi:hypothetical protein KDA_45670 [Dictyobacter alpinus]|uniref:Uncharacterized protein n=1 Tax=Dictyobacter alpinus TaxID=2014873 RepID=A0A402BCH4_9CHLR|nr:hypothetical protein KDA_45670 [Dictyobacter alpinus]